MRRAARRASGAGCDLAGPRSKLVEEMPQLIERLMAGPTHGVAR